MQGFNSIQTRVTQEEGTTIKELPSSDWLVDMLIDVVV